MDTIAHRRVQATIADLKRKATTSIGPVSSSSSSSTTSNIFDGATYDSTLITNLHVHATLVPSVHQLVNIVLDTMSSNYIIWRDLILMALTRYSVANHVLSDDTFTDDVVWTRMDIVVLC
jgi:hypothetical protein